MTDLAQLKEIDGIRLPRIRIGYRKPEPEVVDKPDGRKRVRVQFVETGTIYKSKAEAMRYFGLNADDLRKCIERGLLRVLDN